jgi:hypothetical protein
MYFPLDISCVSNVLSNGYNIVRLFCNDLNDTVWPEYSIQIIVCSNYYHVPNLNTIILFQPDPF